MKQNVQLNSCSGGDDDHHHTAFIQFLNVLEVLEYIIYKKKKALLMHPGNLEFIVPY